MKLMKSSRLVVIGIACGALLSWAQANAENLLLNVKIKLGDKTVDATQVTAPLDKETVVVVGSEYKLKVIPTLGTSDLVRLQVHIDASAGHGAADLVTSTVLGLPATFVNGGAEDPRVEITPQKK